MYIINLQNYAQQLSREVKNNQQAQHSSPIQSKTNSNLKYRNTRISLYDDESNEFRFLSLSLPNEQKKCLCVDVVFV